MLANGIKLAISGHDTLRPLGIYFRPFANSVHDTKYHKRCIGALPSLNIVHPPKLACAHCSPRHSVLSFGGECYTKYDI